MLTRSKSLGKFGLKADSVSLEARSTKVSGTAAAMEAAFKPNLSMMQSPDQGEYRGRIGTYAIPANLNGIVRGVFGLDERRMARRKARTAKLASAQFALAPLTPADLEYRYNFPPGAGAGQSIAIGEFGGGYFAEDAAAYCNKFQRPIPTISPVAVDAPAYTLHQILALRKKQRDDALGDSVEVMMDVEIIAGLCLGAEISVYFSPFDQGVGRPSQHRHRR
jgi:kumamolisin